MNLIIDWQLQTLHQRAASIVELDRWTSQFPTLLNEKLNPQACGEFKRWQTALQHVQNYRAHHIDLSTDMIIIGRQNDLTDAQHQALVTQLMVFHPWRKGPFQIFGHLVDCEWRSDWKWKRLAPHIQSLKDRVVLDVGCGNGYFGWRMLGVGARLVIGIDPTPLFNWQWQLMHQWIANANPEQDRLLVLPTPLEQLPEKLRAFDTVFSMGVLYHRRSPLDHLTQLMQALKPGGELVLETLIIDGSEGMSLLPSARYAQMRNIWFIPTVATLEQWLKRVGFYNVRCIDISITTPDEQRSTPWMQFKSLTDFLNPSDASKTIEGHPAPKRALILASA